MAQTWQEVADFKQERQEVSFKFNADELTLRMTADKGGYFSKEHQRDFSVISSENLVESLNEIQKFLEQEHFSAEFYPQIESRLSQFRFLTVAECQAIHMPLSRPLSESSLEGLIAEVERYEGALRAPAQSVQSLKVTEVELEGEKVELRLSLDSQGVPTGVGLVKPEGDFRELKLSSKDGVYSLYNTESDWIMDIVLLEQAGKLPGLKNGRIEIEIHRPTQTGELSEVQKELLLLKVEEGSWHSSQGLEGVDLQTYQEEAQQVLREYGGHEIAKRYQDSFTQWLTQCKVYESQLQLSSLEQGYFCRELTPFQINYFKGLDQIKGDVAKASFSQRYRKCLSLAGAMSGDPLSFELDVSTVEQNLELGNRCLDEAYLPYAQDELVSSLLDEQSVSSLVNTDSLKKTFSKTLHKEAFNECEERKISLSSQKCQKEIDEVKDDFLVKTKVSKMASGHKGLKNEDPFLVRQEILQHWSGCRDGGSTHFCAQKALSAYGKEFSKTADFNLKELSSELQIPLQKYQKWRKLFEAKLNTCVDRKTKNSEDVDQLVMQFSFILEDCRELASLEIFPRAYKEFLAQNIFSKLSGSRPELWEKLFSEASTQLQLRMEQQGFLHKDELIAQLPGIIKEDTAKIGALYLNKLVERGLVKDEPLESLRKTYKLSKTQKQDWKEALQNLFEGRPDEEVETLLYDFYLNVERAQLYSIVSESSLNQQDQKTSRDFAKDCMQKSPNDIGLDFGHVALNCRKQLKAQKMLLETKREFEQLVSEHFSLSRAKANDLLSPVWYMGRCQRELPHEQLSQEDYLAQVQVCLDLARMDVYDFIIQALIEKNGSLMTSKNKGNPIEVSRQCLQNTLQEMQQANDSLSLKQVIEIQKDHFELNVQRPLLSRLFPEEYMANSKAQKEAQQIRRYIGTMQNYPEFRGNWVHEHLESCLEQAQKMIHKALRESFLQHSAHFQGKQTNLQGETDIQVMRHILDDELINLVLELRDQRAAPSGRSGLPQQGEAVTAEFTFEALSRAQSVISEKLAQGFIFDRDQLKTELVIFRDQLKEGLRWMNTRTQEVTMAELAKFFEASSLADMMAYAEISSMVYDRFSDFLNQMKDKELSEFEEQVGHRPNSHMTQAEIEMKSEIVQRYERLDELVHQMTSSYDFRRIVRQDQAKGRELLGLLKRHFLLAQVSGQEVSTQAYERTWHLMSELIIEDKTPGGFAERFVAEMAQSHLDRKEQSKWKLTKALFYDDEDFEWEELRKTASGQRALKYYARYLLFPKVMGRAPGDYLEQLRRAEFERYLDRAQDEN